MSITGELYGESISPTRPRLAPLIRPVDGCFRLLPDAREAPVHAFGVERHGDIAEMIDGDHAAAPADVRQPLKHHVLDRLLQRFSAVLHLRGDIISHHRADEHLAHSGPGNGGRVVVGVAACPDDRRISHSARALVGHAAGGGGSGQVAFGIKRDGANRAVFSRIERAQRRVVCD